MEKGLEKPERLSDLSVFLSEGPTMQGNCMRLIKAFEI
jgi:hypothetical protein